MDHRLHPLPAATAALALCLLAGCGTASGPSPDRATAAPGQATATLAPTGAVTPNPVAGRASFSPLAHGVRVTGEVRGLAPNSEHGFHIHEKGDCGNDGEAAGGHFNAGGTVHGKFDAPGSHAGDLPSLRADDAGVARFDIESHAITLGTGAANDVLGRALVVHRDRDDFTSQPAGNAGPRVACGVITR